MIILNSGYSVTVDIPAGGSLTVESRGSALVEAVSGLGVTAGTLGTVDGSQTFGQYATAGTIRITANGADCSYSVNENSTLVQAVNNAVGVLSGNSLLAANGMFDIRTHGAKCDGQAIFDGVVSAVGGGIYQLVSATGTFKASDVGLKAGLTRLASGKQFGYDTVITSVISSTTIQFSSGAAPTSTTGYMYVWGTDDSVAIQAACTAAGAKNPRGTVFFPNNIICSGAKVSVPNGVMLCGVAGNSMMDQLYPLRPSGSYVAAIDYFSGLMFDFGATLAGGGVMAFDLTFDAMNIVSGGVNPVGKGNVYSNFACLRGTYRTMIPGPSAVVEKCFIAGQQRGVALYQSGDSRVNNNYILGAQASTGTTLNTDWFPTVQIQGSDLQFCNNHVIRDGDVNPKGDLVLVTCDTGVKDGEILISANNFDTPVGACIYVKVSGTATLRTLNIEANTSITNDAVQNQPSATFSGSITSNVLTVSAITAGTIYTGAMLAGGTVAAGVTVGAQLTGTPGGAGTYTCVGADATGITSATGYPYIILDVAAGCTIRSLNVHGNSGFGSWNDPTKSPYACFIDGSRMLGTVIVANVTGNNIDNCGAGYSNFAQGTGAVTGGTVTTLNSSSNYVIPNTNQTTTGTTPASF